MQITSDGIASGSLKPADYGKGGDLTSSNAELTLVVGAAKQAESWIAEKQWALLWRDADLLYSSPRPMTVYENTYVLEPKRLTPNWACL